MSIFDDTFDVELTKYRLKNFLIEHSWYDVLIDDNADKDMSNLSIVYYLIPKTEEDEGYGWKFQNKFHHTYKIVTEDGKVKLKFNPHASLYILIDEDTYSIPDDIMECLNGINIEIVHGVHFDKVYIV